MLSVSTWGGVRGITASASFRLSSSSVKLVRLTAGAPAWKHGPGNRLFHLAAWGLPAPQHPLTHPKGGVSMARLMSFAIVAASLIAAAVAGGLTCGG
jgi:hypothetical protein